MLKLLSISLGHSSLLQGAERKMPGRVPVKRITVKKGEPIVDYVLEAIKELNVGPGAVEFYAEGRNICLLADVVVELRDRMGEGFRITGWEIKSRRVKGTDKRRTTLLLRLERQL